MDWALISQKVTDDDDTVFEFIKTNKSFKSASIGLLYTWEDWVAAATEDEILAAYIHIQTMLKHFYPNKESFHACSIRWRKPVGIRFGKRTPIYYQALVQLGLTKEESLARREKYEIKVRQQIRNEKYIFSAAQVYDCINKCLQVDNFGHNFVAACIATGSRMIEVAKVTDFTESAAGENYIHIEKTAKSHLRRKIIRPIIGMTSKTLLSLIEKIRSHKDFQNMTNVEVKTNVIVSSTKALKNFFPLTMHKCRYIWAAMAWKLYGGSVPQQEWVREMLGHESGDVSLTYLTFNCVVD
jgi:hypothetical protein